MGSKLTAMIKGCSLSHKSTELALIVNGVDDAVKFSLPIEFMVPAGGCVDFYRLDGDVEIKDNKLSHSAYDIGAVRDLNFTFYAGNMKLLTELRKAEEEAGYRFGFGVSGGGYPNPFD